MYRRDPITSSSPPPEATRSRSHTPGDKAGTYVTQPTQPLGARSPYFAVPGSPTQPTQILTPRANRMYPVSSQLQVPRSSPPVDRTSPPFETQSYSQAHPQPAFKPMRPPGTGFAPPTAVRKPIFDLTSDDPPVEPDPFASESEYKSNIPVSKGDLSSKMSRVAETPEKPSWNLSSYAYNGSANQRKRSFSGTDDSSPKKMRVQQRQGGPSRAIPIDLTSEDVYTSVDQILDPDLRKKTERMRAIFPSEPIQKLYDALIKKRGHFDDAMAYITEQEFESIPSSPNFGVAKPVAETAKKATTQRTLIKPVESILDKYSRLKSTQSQPVPISPASPEIEQPKRKRKLIRGRKNPLPSSPDASPAKPPSQPQKRTQVVSDDEDEGIVNISDDESVREPTPEGVSQDDSLLEFFNSCSVEAMVDLSGHKEEDVRETLDKRPFAYLEAVKKIHVDSQLSQNTDKKKKARKPRITFGARLVESAEDMWDAYSLMDSVVTQCEELGKPMVAGMSRWGIDIFGGSTEEGVDVTSLDDSSDSSRDSGYHTPRSDVGDSNIRKATKKTKLIKQPAIMNDGVELKDYQVVGLNWLNLLWQNKISGILADDMGLGKTCQVIAFLSHLKMQNTGKPALIIVPGSTLENWLREFQRFSGTINFTPYYGPQAERYEYQNTILHNISQGECDVIITTYDLTFRKDDNGFLRRCRPQICIFDEGHVLKNATTIRYRSLLRIKTDIRILLTGTPLQNSLQELMSILGFLMPDVFYKDHDENGVKIENCVPEMLQTLFKHKAKVTETESHSTLLSAQRIQRARTMLTPFILRRKKAQVLKHLPKKTSRVEYCDLTETQEVLYKQQLEKQRKILQDRAAGIYVKDHANVMMKLRQAAIHPLLFRHRYTDDKIRKMSKACLKEETFMESNPDIIFEELQIYQDYQCHQLATKYPRALSKFELKNNEWMDSGKVSKLIELLQRYKENGDRALVFSQFTSVMDILGWVFDTSDIPYMRMDGSTPIKERQSLMDDFYADESIGVFMISTKSGGAGINLACANKVVIFDSSFNPQDDIQAENRAHRVGQTREVEVVRLVTRNTVEEQIYALGVSKLELDKLVQGEDGEEGSEKKGKKKAEAAGAGDALSKAEEAGMQAVEKMLMEQIEGQGKVESETKDVKEQFMDGLKKAGVKVAE